jgi:hypothetical protein
MGSTRVCADTVPLGQGASLGQGYQYPDFWEGSPNVCVCGGGGKLGRDRLCDIMFTSDAVGFASQCACACSSGWAHNYR